LSGISPRSREPISLTGADCFLRAFDSEIRRNAGASHVSQLVLRLGPGFDVGIFTKLIEEVARAQPISRAPIGRRFGVGAPVYRMRAAAKRPYPPVVVHHAATRSDPLPACFSSRLNEPLSLRRGELLRFDVVRYADGSAGSDLAASWAHLLFDGSGSERFIRWLDECFRGARNPDTLPMPDEFAPVPYDGPNVGERGHRARAWQRWVHGQGESQMHSLAGPLRRTRQDLRYEVHTLSEGETERAEASARSRAGFLTPMLFYLAAAIRAHHAVFRDRGELPESYVIPLPVNLRPKGSEGAIFRTHTSLLWFRVKSEQVADFDELLSSLKQQRVSAIKDGHVENSGHAMHFARFAPTRLYSRMARAALRGELCSFFFAYTGEFLSGMRHFLGCEIEQGFHVPPVPPSPGSCAAISVFAGRMNVTHVHQNGLLSERERGIFRDTLRTDLLA